MQLRSVVWVVKRLIGISYSQAQFKDYTEEREIEPGSRVKEKRTEKARKLMPPQYVNVPMNTYEGLFKIVMQCDADVECVREKNGRWDVFVCLRIKRDKC